MEAALYLSHPPSLSSLHPPKSSVSLFNSNRSTLSYSSRLIATNYKQHPISNFPISLNTTGTRPQRHAHVFHQITCAIDDGRVPARKHNGNEDKKPGSIVRSATVVLACTVLGIIMSSNGRLIQAKAIPYFQGNKPTASTPMPSNTTTIQQIKTKLLSMGPKEAIDMLKSEYKEAFDNEDVQKALLIDIMLVERLTVQGEYREALARNFLSSIESPKAVDSKIEVQMAGPKLYLYKTFLYTMTNDKMQAKTWCEALLDKIKKGQIEKRLISMQRDDDDDDE